MCDRIYNFQTTNWTPYPQISVHFWKVRGGGIVDKKEVEDKKGFSCSQAKSVYFYCVFVVDPLRGDVIGFSFAIFVDNTFFKVFFSIF